MKAGVAGPRLRREAFRGRFHPLPRPPIAFEISERRRGRSEEEPAARTRGPETSVSSVPSVQERRKRQINQMLMTATDEIVRIVSDPPPIRRRTTKRDLMPAERI